MASPALVNGAKKRPGRRSLVQPVLPALPVLAKTNKQKQKPVTHAVRPASPSSSSNSAPQLTEESQSAVAEINGSRRPTESPKNSAEGLEAANDAELNHMPGS